MIESDKVKLLKDKQLKEDSPEEEEKCASLNSKKSNETFTIKKYGTGNLKNKSLQAPVRSETFTINSPASSLLGIHEEKPKFFNQLKHIINGKPKTKTCLLWNKDLDKSQSNVVRITYPDTGIKEEFLCEDDPKSTSGRKFYKLYSSCYYFKEFSIQYVFVNCIELTVVDHVAQLVQDCKLKGPLKITVMLSKEQEEEEDRRRRRLKEMNWISKLLQRKTS